MHSSSPPFVLHVLPISSSLKDVNWTVKTICLCENSTCIGIYGIRAVVFQTIRTLLNHGYENPKSYSFISVKGELSPSELFTRYFMWVWNSTVTERTVKWDLRIGKRGPSYVCTVGVVRVLCGTQVHFI
jgi:hypothetical protein